MMQQRDALKKGKFKSSKVNSILSGEAVLSVLYLPPFKIGVCS